MNRRPEHGSSAPTPADVAVVSRIAVFRGLKPETIQRIVAPATVATLREREVLFRQGDPATAFFITLDGWVKLYRITLAGEETVIHVLTKGDSFAEAVAFTGASYPATAEAVSEARVVRIPADHVVRCIREMPDIALAMIASTSQHLHHLVQQVEQLKAQSGVQRVAEFLAGLCPGDQGGCMIALPYDKVLIAARLGLKPESLSRAFAKLRSFGVDVRASHVAVRDIARLRQLAADDRGAIRGTLHAPPRAEPLAARRS
ncbi:MAG: Crp/Fnr family transcriptional regulator [Xanthobacteraceae bacterium]|nr:Crp/Fnr family transcriptional regulator [Xanthobacteraceae bacterium]PWB61182.1 MAG: cyclic nucleotide-binding protein [Bradyrhizobiaceae bacterium]